MATVVQLRANSGQVSSFWPFEIPCHFFVRMPAALIADLQLPAAPEERRMWFTAARGVFLEKYAAVKEDDEMRIYWVKAKIEADCFGMV